MENSSLFARSVSRQRHWNVKEQLIAIFFFVRSELLNYGGEYKLMYKDSKRIIKRQLKSQCALFHTQLQCESS